MITDAQAEKAADWIYENCQAIADAKAEKVYREERMRVVRSEVILDTEGTAAHKEATAFASHEYSAELLAYKEAVRNESFLQTKLKAAEQRIEVWRSQSANLRGLR